MDATHYGHTREIGCIGATQTCHTCSPLQAVFQMLGGGGHGQHSSSPDSGRTKKHKTGVEYASWADTLRDENAYHAHSLAYAKCTALTQVSKLDHAKTADGKRILNCNNSVRLAKMEQLELAQELELLQGLLEDAHDKLEDAVAKEIERHEANSVEIGVAPPLLRSEEHCFADTRAQA